MIAAMMTAANLGARVTGWGFAIFTVGSLAWSLLGVSTGQTNLLATNVFLTFINLVGVWRWLGRQRAYEDGGKSAEAASRRSRHPNLFTATGISGMPVKTADGRTVGKAVEALVACETGNVSYVVVASAGIGGIAERLRAVAHEDIRFACEHMQLVCDLDRFEALPPLNDSDWPAAPARARGSTSL
ncbi:MAG: PRC-barrel domain containing protein [Novosphingobium sp.]|nr:PRC-barrel domain containing protein [Novosphingobium sp.]